MYRQGVADNLMSKKFDASQRSMVARDLEPHFAAQAKERQLATLKQNSDTVVEKVPQRITPKSRDAAGKAAGVNGRYVDMASVANYRHPPAMRYLLAAFIVASCKPSPKVEFEGETVAEEIEAMEGQPDPYPLEALTPEQRRELEAE